MAGEDSPLLDSCSNINLTNKSRQWTKASTEPLTLYNAQHPNMKKAAYLLRDAIILAQSNSPFAHTDYLISIEGMRRASQVGSSAGGAGTAASDPFARTGLSRFFQKFLMNPYVQTFFQITIYSIILLSFLEPPSWCRSFNDGDSNPIDGCQTALNMKGKPAFYSDASLEAEIQPYYPNTGTTVLTVQESLKIEWILVSILLFHLFVCLGKDEFSIEKFFHITVSRDQLDPLTARRIKMSTTFRYIRVLALFLLVKGMAGFSLETPERNFAVLLRMILFITYSEGIQSEIMVVGQIIPKLLSVLLVLGIVILFYGLIGVAAFYGTLEGTEQFSNIIEAVWTLFTSMTTVIYPDVMMAGYNDNRFVALYFISYMILTFFFFQNIILGQICDVYNDTRSAKDTELIKARDDLCRKAFDLLTSDSEVDYVTKQQLMGLFLILNEDCEEIHPIPQEDAELLYTILDKNGSDTLELDEFVQFEQVMLLEFDQFDRYNPMIEKMFPSLLDNSIYTAFQGYVKSAEFDKFVDLVLLVNAIVVIAQNFPMLAGRTVTEDPKLSDGLIDTGWEYAETMFTLFYTFEMVSKITILSWKKYSSSLKNWFDGIITVFSIAATIYVYYPNSYNNTGLIRFVVMARVFRITRLLLVIPSFNAFSNTFIGILPAASRVLLVLFCLVYTFSWIGMIWFGGLLTRDPNSATAASLEGTDFADAFYWANNFNDLLSGMNVCFNLLVINNWNVFESGILAVTQSHYSRYFFFTFYFFGVTIMNNIVVSLVIDFYIDELDSIEAAETEDDGGNVELNDAFLNEREIVFRNRVARIRSKYHRLTAVRSKKFLKKLFSSKFT